MHVKVRQRSKAKTFMQKKVPQAESRRAHWYESSPQTAESKHVERVRCDARHHHALPTGVGRNGGVL